jgi:HAD superfamily hydrolase (TIGR01662 family)
LKTEHAALFDLDGTLIDSAAEITWAVNVVLSQYSQQLLTIDQVAPLIGQPGEKLFRQTDFGLDRAVLVREFRNVLRESPEGLAVAFPFVEQLLEVLQESGIRLAVVTNKPTDLAEHVLRRQGLLGIFNVVQGVTGLSPKPSPQMVLTAMKKLNAKTGVMVGDMESDVKAGNRAGLVTVAIAPEIGRRRQLQSCGANFNYESFRELFCNWKRHW